ncbi:MAG: FadR/GntR family transcriptional regulator [Candidatus Korobacteraceae bacterium]|jgi:GntR family transcriptional regulator, transcriptional repressor for pyruvate dehydrogenase complex
MLATEAPAKVGFETIPRNKVYQAVARQLERHITERLKPGDLLPPERQLVQMLGVSRGSVRDAIRSLELKGLLEPRQGVGTVVRSPGAGAANPLADALLEKRKLVAELIDVRKMIEPHLARRAALHASHDEIAEMEDILARQEAKLRRGELAVEEDSEFHYSIALASNNSAILKVVDVLMDLLRETREHSLQGKGRQEKSLAGHHRILSALKRQDGAAAELAMLRHLQEIENIALKKL